MIGDFLPEIDTVVFILVEEFAGIVLLIRLREMYDFFAG